MSNVLLRSLPYAIRGFTTVDANGEQIIIINSKYTSEINKMTYLHEISHYSDFYEEEVNVDKLELSKHRS